MSSLLLDTSALLWLLSNDDRMGPDARARITTATRVYYSAASVWEIEIKRATGKVVMDADLGAALNASGLTELPITARDALAVNGIELPHRDPFDRLLLTQAIGQQIQLLTSDAILLGLGRHDVLDARA